MSNFGIHAQAMHIMILAYTSLPPDRVSLPPRRAAGPDAHSVGQGLTVTAALTPDPLTLTHERALPSMNRRLGWAAGPVEALPRRRVQ